MYPDDVLPYWTQIRKVVLVLKVADGETDRQMRLGAFSI